MKRAAILLCLSGLLAGCGSDASTGPVSLPPVSSVAGMSPSVAPTVPAAVPKPPEADAFTSEGAAAFVRYYIDVINAAILSNDTTLLAALSAPECEGCQHYVRSIRKTEAERARVETSGLRVLEAVAPAVQNGETTVLLDFDAGAYVSKTPNGQVVNNFPAHSKLTAELRCVRRGTSWIVMGFRSVTVTNGT